MGQGKRTRDAAAAFFYKHAGWGYDPKTETPRQGRWRGARLLAEAERHAARMGWCFCWEPDDDDTGDGDTTPNERFGCIVKNEAGDVLASLWSIGDPDPNYSRVAEAELALEAMDTITNEVMEAI